MEKVMKIGEMNINSTALIIVDMVNGFIRYGALSDSRIEKIINPICEIQAYFKENKGKIVAFIDSHSEDAIEFESFPKHCIKGTIESEVVDEIKAIGGYIKIEKNSTNGFVEEKFQEFLRKNNDIENFIIVGCCTDICVMQLALSMKTYFNKENKKSRVIVIENSVETYSIEGHNGDELNKAALNIMATAGIEIINKIEI